MSIYNIAKSDDFAYVPAGASNSKDKYAVEGVLAHN